MHTDWNPDCFFLSSTAFYRPKISASACLLGEKVRYDGTDKYHLLINKTIVPRCTIVPCCPETSVGMGVPRETIQLIKTPEGIQAYNIDKPSLNPTTALREFANNFNNNNTGIDAYIVKARSPSCGFNSTPLHDTDNNIVGTDSGLFIKQIAELAKAKDQPLLIADEEFFAEELHCIIFLFFCLLQKEKRLLQHHTEKKQLERWSEHYRELLDCKIDIPFSKLILSIPKQSGDTIRDFYFAPLN